MATAAGAWDVLAKAANVAQMFAMLIAVFNGLLRVQRSNTRECAELERRTRRLHALLLQWPAATGAQLCSEMVIVGPVVRAVGDAAGLVESYKKSSLWRRVRSGGRTATRLQDMQDVVNSYCGLLLFVNAHLLLLQQQATHHHAVPPSSTDTSTPTIPEVNDDTSQTPSARAESSRPEVTIFITETCDDERSNEGVESTPTQL